MDSGEEWDKDEHGDWLHCPTPPTDVGGLTWEEVTGESTQRRVIIAKEAPTWDDVTSDHLQGKVASNKEDSDWDADTQTPAVLQFEDTSVQDSPHKETFMDTLKEPPVDSLQEENLVEASMGLGSQDVVQIHMENDNLD